MRIPLRKPRTAAEWLGAVSAALLILLVAAVGTYRTTSTLADRTPVAHQDDKPFVSNQTMQPALPTVTEIKAGSQKHSDQRTFLIGVADKCMSEDTYYVHVAPLTPNGEYTVRIKSKDGSYDSGNLVDDGATADKDGSALNLPLKCGGFSPGTYSFMVTDSKTQHTMSFDFTSVLLGK